jgi:hypothetical protein
VCPDRRPEEADVVERGVGVSAPYCAGKRLGLERRVRVRDGDVETRLLPDRGRERLFERA